MGGSGICLRAVDEWWSESTSLMGGATNGGCEFDLRRNMGFQSLDKWLRYLFNIPKWTWLPGSPSIPQSILVTGRGCHTLLSILNFPTLGLGFLFPGSSSLYNPDILFLPPLSLHALLLS